MKVLLSRISRGQTSVRISEMARVGSLILLRLFSGCSSTLPMPHSIARLNRLSTSSSLRAPWLS